MVLFGTYQKIAKLALTLKVHEKKEDNSFVSKVETLDLQDEIEDEGFL